MSQFKLKGRYRVHIRSDIGDIREEARQLDGQIYTFVRGWKIHASDSSLYVGETAMIPQDDTYPPNAPPWIASGDLVEITVASEEV